jgi:hypothetical protein
MRPNTFTGIDLLSSFFVSWLYYSLILYVISILRYLMLVCNWRVVWPPTPGTRKESIADATIPSIFGEWSAPTPGTRKGCHYILYGPERQM